MVKGFRSFGISVSNEGLLADTLRLARACDEARLPSFWIPESYHYRSLSVAATMVAVQTQHLGIGIGVMNPYTRHPALIAMEAASVDEVARGRVTLGLGAALFTARKYGLDPRTQPPLQAVREAVMIVRSLLAGDEAPSGRVFRFTQPVRLGFQPFRRRMPIVLGAVNQRMLELAGEIADGAYLGALTTPSYVRYAKRCVEAGSRRAHRRAAECPLIANVLLSVDHDGEAARQVVPRELLASYLLRVEPVVREQAAVAKSVFEGVKATFEKGGLRAAATALPDRVIDTFAVAGTPADCARSLGAFAESGLDVPLAWYVLGPRPLAAVALIKEMLMPLLSSEPRDWLA